MCRPFLDCNDSKFCVINKNTLPPATTAGYVGGYDQCGEVANVMDISLDLDHDEYLRKQRPWLSPLYDRHTTVTAWNKHMRQGLIDDYATIAVFEISSNEERNEFLPIESLSRAIAGWSIAG